MEKYILENQNAGQIRSPSPTMSLPPSWVYPSNMPGRVKTIPPALENGCSKIEMELSRHQPYQLNASLFVLNPVKDPISTLPRRAPHAKNLLSNQTLFRQTSLSNNPNSHFTSQCMSPQLPLSPTAGPSNPASGQPRISSPMPAFSPEQVSSPRSGVKTPRPTFSAKKAGIAPQVWKPSMYHF
uniref:Synaptopodin n=1 Tax=Anabas testudineus TaxID=64144 RepID=A0A7N5ZR25_ANATE